MRTITISDLSKCLPSNRLSRHFKKGCWRLVDYETESGVAGTMVFGDPEDRPGEIELPIELTGRYHIFVGINYTRTHYGDVLHLLEFPLYGQTWIKLTGDIGFSRVAAEVMYRHGQHFTAKTGREMEIWKSVQETYWKTADLTGESLIIAVPGPPYDTGSVRQMSNLAYIKLVPASSDEIVVGAKPPTEQTKRGAMLWCSAMLTGHTKGTPVFHPTDMQWYRDEFAPLIGSDIGIFSFEAIRGNLCAYPTAIGDTGAEENKRRSDWIDPLRAFTDLAHENGMLMFASMRMIGKGFPMIRTPIGRARFLAEHPEWAKRDKRGVPASGLSLAFPEVCDYWLSLLREVLDYGIDGVQLHLNRSFPHVLYEEPTVRHFKETYGMDPRALSENDPRWIAHNRHYLTAFLRRVSELVRDEYGRKLAVTVLTPRLEEENPKLDVCAVLDLETWLREDLVDIVVPNPGVESEHVRRWKDWSDGKVTVLADLEPRTQPGEVYAELVSTYNTYGVDGFALWDGERRPPRLSEWAVIRKLGHTEDLESLKTEARRYYRRIPLRMLDGISVAYSYEDG